MIDFLWWFVASSHTFYLYLKPAILFNAYYANVFLSLLKFPYVPFPQFLATGEMNMEGIARKMENLSIGEITKNGRTSGKLKKKMGHSWFWNGGFWMQTDLKSDS